MGRKPRRRKEEEKNDRQVDERMNNLMDLYTFYSVYEVLENSIQLLKGKENESLLKMNI